MTMGPMQLSVNEWILEAFGDEVAYSKTERNHRFLEESLELVQSLGCTREEAYQLVDYVYDRPTGDPEQEVGGVMLTLMALCTAAEISASDAANKEIRRVWEKIDVIRAKQAAKPKNSPLPGKAD